MPEAETIGVNFARRYQIQGVDADALAKLRALSVAESVDGGQESAGPGGAVTYSGPILDGRLTVETAQKAYQAGRAPRIPLIIGSNSADFVGFISADTKEALFSQFGERKAEAMAAYDPNGTTELRTLVTMAGVDRVQAEPARFTASAFVAKGAPAYVYRFSYVPASMRERWRNGVPHAAEIAYVFDTLGVGNPGGGPGVDPAPAPTPEDSGRRSESEHLLGQLRQDRRPEWTRVAEMAASRSQQERDPRVPARRCRRCLLLIH